MPVSAMPAPLKRPLLFRICELATWPKTMASTPAGKMKNKNPLTPCDGQAACFSRTGLLHRGLLRGCLRRDVCGGRQVGAALVAEGGRVVVCIRAGGTGLHSVS